MKNKLYFVIVGVAFVLIPVALYFLLPLPQLCNGLGGEEMWLGFWGSYLGGVFTAIIGILTLLYSNRQQHKQIKIEYKKEYVRQLEQNLAESICIFNASTIQKFIFSFNDDSIDKSEARLYLRDMNEYYEDIQQKLKSFGLLYQTTDAQETEQKEFYTLYTDISKTYMDIISKVQGYIYFLLDSKSNELTKQYLESLIKETDRIDNTKAQVEKLYTLAQDWLKIEREELLNMQK